MADHIYVNDRVKVVAHWSSFVGMRGVVTQTKPYMMVRFDGDRYSIRIEEPSVEREEASTTNLTGADDTGEVRAFLCRHCNLMIGHAEDSPARLRAGAAYLDKRQPKLRLVR